jgi:hypothetical protein
MTTDDAISKFNRLLREKKISITLSNGYTITISDEADDVDDKKLFKEIVYTIPKLLGESTNG